MYMRNRTNETENKPNWTGLWSLEWNEKQGKFHIEFADTRFADNTDEFLNKIDNRGWNMLGIFNSYTEADKYAEEITLERKSMGILKEIE